MFWEETTFGGIRVDKERLAMGFIVCVSRWLGVSSSGCDDSSWDWCFSWCLVVGGRCFARVVALSVGNDLKRWESHWVNSAQLC